ncbi:MAG: c-type cytochrome [Chloroflexi bacterium]|nr:c-type cytochrome [Chloroflexota bacterium]
MKNRLPVVLLLALLLTAAVAGTVLADDGQPPAPYAGMTNPFPWDDAGALDSGQKVYAKSCLGCHGVAGDGVAAANFALPGFAAGLETAPDHTYWAISEGMLSKGMPPFKSVLSEEQRWQVETYLWSLGQPAPAAPAPTGSPSTGAAGNLALSISEQTYSPAMLMLTAYLSQANGEPVSGQTIRYYLKKEFFATGWLGIGALETDKQGMATLTYTPRENGDIQVRVTSGDLQTETAYTLKAAAGTYQAEAGIRLPTLGPELAMGGTRSALDAVDMSAPAGGIRLPGGTLSWLLFFVGTVLLIWGTYFRVIRQVLGIAGEARVEKSAARLIPVGGMIFVFILGIILAFMILNGPYTHLNLLR